MFAMRGKNFVITFIKLRIDIIYLTICKKYLVNYQLNCKPFSTTKQQLSNKPLLKKN